MTSNLSKQFPCWPHLQRRETGFPCKMPVALTNNTDNGKPQNMMYQGRKSYKILKPKKLKKKMLVEIHHCRVQNGKQLACKMSVKRLQNRKMSEGLFLYTLTNILINSKISPYQKSRGPLSPDLKIAALPAGYGHFGHV